MFVEFSEEFISLCGLHDLRDRDTGGGGVRESEWCEGGRESVNKTQ